jgi:hypothetical protein
MTAVRTAVPAADLRQIARHLDAQLRANRRPAITDANALDVQALCVAEEAGELVGAYRRWAGKARRTGTRTRLRTGRRIYNHLRNLHKESHR